MTRHKPAEGNGPELRGYGAHVTISELKRICEGRLKAVSLFEWQLASHVSAGCRLCWARLREAAQRHPGFGEWSSPLAAAVLGVLDPQVERLNELSPLHRAAVTAAGEGGPEFCMLLFKEAAAVSEGLPRRWNLEPVHSALVLASANLALMGRPQACNELFADYLLLTSRDLCARKDSWPAGCAVPMAQLHVYSGCGGAEPRAGVLECLALMEAQEGRVPATVYLVNITIKVLGEYPFPDRRAEVLCNAALELAGSGESNRGTAITLLERAEAEFAGLAPVINRRLRLRIVHHLSLLESEGVMRSWARGGDPENGLVKRTTARLRQAGPLYEELWDPEINRQRQLIRARLHLACDPAATASTFVRAVLKITGPDAAAVRASLMADLLLQKAQQAPGIEGSPLSAELFRRIRRVLGPITRDPAWLEVVFPNVLTALAARAPRAAAVIDSVLNEALTRWRCGWRGQPGEGKLAQRRAAGLVEQAAATGFHTADAAVQSASALSKALSFLDHDPSASDWPLRLRILFLLVETRFDQQFTEVYRKGAPVGGALASALRDLDAQPVKLRGRPLKELRALRNALDARAVVAHSVVGAEELFASAMRSLSQTDAVELAALARFQLLRFLACGRHLRPAGALTFEPGGEHWNRGMSSDFRRAVDRQVVDLLDLGYGAKQRLAIAIAALFEPAGIIAA